ncbi:radical SAM protein [Fervidicoccus fontis]|uniref:Radical SAM protein n=1 Tax=Fervidicoccus fontis TaxID=683846 RepID=A0A843ALG8_9CREN|nr:radical SAM protein [Fervidicoccus fontis]MBE9391751.1 radical SAM protein [Fervidicoccus fontis]
MVILESKLGLTKVGKVLEIRKPFPLIGHISFGIIDRGYNNLQVRITTLCSLSCIFCSVSAGPKSNREREFILRDPEWLYEWIKYAGNFKSSFHLIFDGMGDPITHKDLPEFVKAVREMKNVKSITVETRLFPANIKTLEKLKDAGIDRLNVSIDTLNEEKGKLLSGNNFYSVKKVKELIKYAHEELGIAIHLAPVWIPTVNDEDIEEIIQFAIKIGLGEKFPPLGIQKYVSHKYGRKVPGIMALSWKEFEKWMKKLEDRYKIKLLLDPKDYGLEKSERIPNGYKKGEIVKLSLVEKGLLKNEYLAIPPKKDRVFTLISRRESLSIGDIVYAKIIHDKDGILIAIPV